MADKVYALAINYRGKCKKLKNIDPDKYSYIDFVADIKKVHAVGDETVFKITCTMDDSNATMNICNDFDVLSMFSRNENRVEFDVFVENVEGDSNGEGDEWIAENGEDTGGRGSENESDDENISGEDSENESVGEDSGDELSDYKSDDHCEPNNFSDSEFEDDPLHGSLNRDACTLPCETGQKVKLEKGMVFVDINAFRKVLKEFVIQEGFKVKTYVPNHTCVRSDPTKEASAEWIASKIESVLRENPGMKARAAIGLDGNNGLFPVAFAVVESECKESWTFFFENLSMMVGGFSVDKPWTFMSDRQKGLVETINEVVPHAINRRCARHIYANFRSQFAGTALKRVWDISGIPCRHAALGISHRREDLDSYCDSRFFKENYMKAYKYSIHPVPDQTFWPHGVDVTPTLLPPIIKRMPGRPKKSRRKEQGEEPNAIRRSNMVKCKVCNELGHNRRTCPNIQPPAPAQVSSSQPLPKKDPVVPSMHAAGSSSQPDTLVSWSSISTTKLLERDRSLSSQGNKEQETQ
ncbi:hypothetical protein Sango_2591100 [Sesamum angolense]|uniref:MULE transposase domain-containing protein n=1 Tax=Sesamum angolense TaxID=2727404 RepID=A0AAE1W5J3_9LAMI|nr:hypothetical protein Sango_2591100 [Sesamum angolense]